MDNVIQVNFSKTVTNKDNSLKEGKLLFLNKERKAYQDTTGNKEFYEMIKDDDIWEGLLFRS